MHDIAVLIPYGNETPWRKAALDTVLGWYARNLPGATVRLGHPADGPWCKAHAVAAALREAGRSSVLVVADADCLTPGLHRAVEAVRRGAPWAMPHLKVHRFDREATLRIHQGADPGSLTGRRVHLDQSPYKGYEGGGVTVLRRETYLDCPLDPCFTGWGQEDEAWALALNALHGPPWREPAPLYHLWHEKPARKSRYAGSGSSVRRLALYKEARAEHRWDEVLDDARRLAQAAAKSCKVAS